MLECAISSAPTARSKALKGISLDVGRGQLVALIGANGAGKSTALRAISGLVPPRSGRLRFDGQNHGRESTARLVAGPRALPRGRRVFPHMERGENLLMGAYLRSDARGIADDEDRIFAEFRACGRRAQAAGTLSGGEQQMLAIGRALMSRPSSLFDEPSLGLAPNIVEQTLSIIRTIRDTGTTVLLVGRMPLPRSSYAITRTCWRPVA